jgi:hypothetical protein
MSGGDAFGEQFLGVASFLQAAALMNLMNFNQFQAIQSTANHRSGDHVTHLMRATIRPALATLMF